LFLENSTARVAQEGERYMLQEGFYKKDERIKGELLSKEVVRRDTTKIVTSSNFCKRNGIC
jgi:hypothetical protein